MKNRFLKYSWSWMLICFFIPVSAQNLNGERIKVSPESLTALKFNAVIMDYQWSDPSGYTCIARNSDNSLLIKTLNDHPSPSNLIVTEGKRTHYFIIDFVEKIDINNTKLYYDYSDLKQLKKLVAMNNAAPPAPKNTEPLEDKKLSEKEKRKLEKEKEEKKKEAEEKKRLEEAERQRLADEQKMQAEKLKEEERLAAAKREAETEKKKQKEEEQIQKEEEARKAKEEERLAALAKEQEKIQAEKERQEQLAIAKEAERQKKAKEEAARIQKLKDQQEAAAAAAKEKKRLEEEKKKQLAEEKERIRQEQERQKQLAILKEQQRKEEEKQKQLAKIAEEKRKKEQAEQAKREAELAKTSYTHTELWKKYPKIVFGDPPYNQHLTGEYYIPNDTAENSRVSYRLMGMDHWLNIASKTENGVTIVLQGLIFSGVNAYLRIIIKNDTDNDFLTGRMNLKWQKADGSGADLFPCYVTDFPIVLPHKEKTMVYAARAVNADNKDRFIFTMSDRLNTTELDFSFTGTAYNLEMSK
ncbi:MAG TPA: hypothetical protein VL098_11350 [Flavipsychrobacter sp.]|nr:hypothetical protein [Flavipsychrobacter sp.]